MTAAMEMAKATYDKLAEYQLKHHGVAPQKSWDEIKCTVEDLLKQYNKNDEDDVTYRVDKWYEKTLEDFPGFNGYFSSEGDADGWSRLFLKAADKARALTTLDPGRG